MQRLRIVTFNIAHGRGLQPIQGLSSKARIRANLTKIGAFLKDLQPDIVALQEIDEDSSWAGRFNHLQFLQEATGMPHAAFGVNNRRTGFLKLNYGNALLSRHPITFSENTVFGARKIGEKGFLYAEVDVAGRCIPVVNMHLHYRLKKERFRQINFVQDYLVSKHAERTHHWHTPPIVCGDMNNAATRNDATSALLEFAHRFGKYTLYPQRARTFPSPLPRRTLDYVFLPPRCSEVFCLVLKSYLSDHRPVMVEFTLT